MQNADKSAVSEIAPINTDVDVLVIGAGFSGLYAMHKLRDELGLLVQGFETADGVGGTWYWNRYPGARCDSAGSVYCFTFNQDIINEWTWSEKYPAQPEILRYLNFVADKLDLKRSFRFSTRIESMTWDEATNHWEVRTNDGDVVHARYVISAVGCLSASNKANFKGMGNFTGESYHTAQWPHHPVSFAKKRVAVIGTGSTAIQAIPVIAEDAAHLTIFQRTPIFSTPAKNYALTPQEQQRYREEAAALHDRIKRTFAGQDLEQIQKSAKDDSPEERKRNFDKLFEAGDFSFWLANYQDVLIDPESNELAAEYLRDRIRHTVRNPAVAEKLVPRSYPYGTKRQALDTNYYETFNRDNVSLVDVNEDPIEEITPKGIRTHNGEHEFDIVVYALGFDAITGPINRMRIVGRGGEVLSEKWKDGPRNYLGLSVSGFPNFFTVTGPGSPSVLSNMPVSIEQHVEWIVGAIQYAEEHGIGVIEARLDAEAEWTGHVNDLAAATLFPRAASWYMGANVPGKPRVFMPYIGGVGTYREKCDDVASSSYKGFDLIRGWKVSSRRRDAAAGVLPNPAETRTMTDFYGVENHGPYEIFDLGDFPLEEGGVIRGCKLAYAAFGHLSATKDNAILVTTWYSGTSKIMEKVFIGPGRPLDPESYFIIVVNNLGNGISSSPHNSSAPACGPRFPRVRIGDDVRAQHRLITEKFGIERLALVVGGSMGAQQTWEWAVRFPDMVARAAPIAGTSKNTEHDFLFAETLIETITSDPAWEDGFYTKASDVHRGLMRHAKLWGVMGWSTEFYRQGRPKALGFPTLEDFVTSFMFGYFGPMDPNNLLCMAWKWQHGDVSRNTGGDLAAALGRITAKTVVLPISHDMIFPISDCEAEHKLTPNSTLEVLNSIDGHLALQGLDNSMMTQLHRALFELLSAAA